MRSVFSILRNGLQRLLNWKVRGIRWIDIIGGVGVAVMILSVYVAKAAADREDRQIARIEQEIAENHQRVRLLRAEIARLEQPARLETLSRSVGLEPVDVHRQATEAQLPNLQARSEARSEARPETGSSGVRSAPDAGAAQ